MITVTSWPRVKLPHSDVCEGRGKGRQEKRETDFLVGVYSFTPYVQCKLTYNSFLLQNFHNKTFADCLNFSLERKT